jgi:FkbM family methyltransferase
MSRKLNSLLSRYAPRLGKPKRLLLAYLAKFSPIKNSYSQLGDDNIAIELLRSIGKCGQLFYVDVGANHPTRISNTYKMYREGSKGVVIEPNSELIHLHKLVRPRDIQLPVGCGSSDKLIQFYSSKTPVLSSFDKNQVADVWGTEYLPVFRLDTIFQTLSPGSIDFMSIDVEGMDLEVLKGAVKTLKFTLLVCIEANSDQDEDSIVQFMDANDFKLAKKNQWNLFFLRCGNP